MKSVEQEREALKESIEKLQKDLEALNSEILNPYLMDLVILGGVRYAKSIGIDFDPNKAIGGDNLIPIPVRKNPKIIGTILSNLTIIGGVVCLTTNSDHTYALTALNKYFTRGMVTREDLQQFLDRINQELGVNRVAFTGEDVFRVCLPNMDMARNLDIYKDMEITLVLRGLV